MLYNKIYFNRIHQERNFMTAKVTKTCNSHYYYIIGTSKFVFNILNAVLSIVDLKYRHVYEMPNSRQLIYSRKGTPINF